MSDIFMIYMFALSLLLPFVAAMMSLVAYRSRASNTIAQLMLAASGVSGFVGVIGYYISDLGTEPLMIAPILSVTPLSAFFLALVYMGTFLTSMYAIASLPPYRDVYSLPWLNVASAFFILGMQVTIMAGTILAFLFAWEIMSVAAYFLVIADRSEDSLRAGFLYFIMTHIGFVSLVAGFLLLAQGNVFASWNDIALSAATLTPTALSLAFLLLFAGFGSKAGLVPLHQWLPYAHPQAPSHSSALLSGTMLKVALFGFIQALFLFPYVPLWWAVVLIVVGLMSGFFGALSAAVETDTKRLLAWSSIENMGLIFAGVGISLALRTISDSVAAMTLASTVGVFVVLHTINHFFFKTGLFMAVGAVASATHTRDLDQLGGLARAWPLFSGVFLALALSAAALPPFGTFFGEWMLLQSLAVGMFALPTLYAISAAIILLVLGLIGGLAIFTFVKLFSVMFLGRERSQHAQDVKGSMSGVLVLAPLMCVLGSIVVALSTASVFSINGMTDSLGGLSSISVVEGASISAWFVYVLLFVAIAIIYAARVLMTNTKQAIVTDTWDCGQPVTPRMQYTATGFGAPIRFFFRDIVLSRKNIVREPIAPGNPWIARRHLESSMSSFWETVLYIPLGRLVVRGSSMVKRIQSGVIQLYLLFVVIALAIVLYTAL